MPKIIYPNLVNDQNRVAHPNILWVMDLFTITLIDNSQLNVFFAIDVYSNDIIAYCVSKDKIINSARIVSSLATQIELRQTEIDHSGKLILHSDRGTQFTSKNYYNFIENNKQWVKPSMAESHSPKRNAVAERFVRTFKNTKINQLTLKETIDQFLKNNKKFNYRLIVSDFVTYLNKKANKKAIQPQKTSWKARAALALQTPPKHRQAFSKSDPRLDYIEDFKNESQNTYDQMQNWYVLTFLGHTSVSAETESIALQAILSKFLDIYQYAQMQNLIKLDSLQHQIENVQNNVGEILTYVKPKVKKNSITQPLRDPVLNSTYLLLLQHAGSSFKKQQKLKTSQLRLLFTIAYFTGCRINEAACLSPHQISQLYNTGKINMVHHKTKQSCTHTVPDIAIQHLQALQPEFDFVFKENQYEYLFGKTKPHHPLSIIRTVNRDIASTSKICNINLNLKSHSFRVGFITQLLKDNDILLVSKIVGHSKIETTLRYNRYQPDSKTIQNILNKTFKNDEK